MKAKTFIFNLENHMATIDTTGMNIVEANKRAGFTNRAEFLAELIKHNDIMKVLPWYPSSNKTFHKSTKAVRLGNGNFTGPNKGYTKITSQADLDTLPLIEYGAASDVDERIIFESDNPRLTRRTEDIMNLQGCIQDFANLLFTSDGTNVRSFKGLMPRRTALSDFCFDAGGSTANAMTSAWLIEMGRYGLNMRHWGGTVGFSNSDEGRQRVVDENDEPYYIWENIYKLKGAPEIKQDRAVLRMANIDTSSSKHTATGWISTDILSSMIDTLPNFGDNAVLFVNRKIHSQVRTLCYEKGNAAYSLMDLENFGKVLSIMGIPVMLQESIGYTEAVVA